MKINRIRLRRGPLAPLRRYIFNTLTVVSLVLLPGVLVTVGLWVDSYRSSFHVRYGRCRPTYSLRSRLGAVKMMRSTINSNSGWKIYFNPTGKKSALRDGYRWYGKFDMTWSRDDWAWEEHSLTLPHWIMGISLEQLHDHRGS